eukprot:6477410-Amphidinium_carterae.1
MSLKIASNAAHVQCHMEQWQGPFRKRLRTLDFSAQDNSTRRGRAQKGCVTQNRYSSVWNPSQSLKKRAKGIDPI